MAMKSSKYAKDSDDNAFGFMSHPDADCAHNRAAKRRADRETIEIEMERQAFANHEGYPFE